MGFMSNILSKAGLGALAVGIALALTPVKASALTVLDSTDAGTGPFSLLTSSYNFQDTFGPGTLASTLSFEFVNDSASTINVVLSSASIIQQSNAYFVEGARVFWDTAGTVAQAAQGQSAANNFNFLLGAGMSDTLNVQFGRVVTTTTNPDIDFTVSAVPIPIPAAGLMLLTALGGLGLARRRRKAA